uniref:Uncharacterized protein n=1 Tax=Timema monikensis TaxID=170555 RepID=A0A7R9EBQ5_9NEOP|nr:unnamed protein product [Timema monikensis]
MKKQERSEEDKKKAEKRKLDIHLQRLCGRRATRGKQAMQIIDVSGDAIMPDPNEWLTKQLTEEQQQKSHSHSHRKNEGPTTQQRRKHQITYLAFQRRKLHPGVSLTHPLQEKRTSPPHERISPRSKPLDLPQEMRQPIDEESASRATPALLTSTRSGRVIKQPTRLNL